MVGEAKRLIYIEHVHKRIYESTMHARMYLHGPIPNSVGLSNRNGERWDLGQLRLWDSVKGFSCRECSALGIGVCGCVITCADNRI